MENVSCGKERTVWAAMSGGVDSSAAAALLVRAGYAVTGATMTLYRPGMRVGADGVFRAPSEGDPSPDVSDARAVCERLGIPHRVLDLGETFCRTVIDDFVRGYASGLTPNPCVVCNRSLKLGALLDAAMADGAQAVATGHYARVGRDASGRYLLRKGADAVKDQSYYLWQLSQAQLSHTLFPLGGMTKAEIRALAQEAGLLTAHKSDSQDICFVPDGDYAAFLEAYTGVTPEPGDYVDAEGHILGRHAGLTRYTVGQRKGLGIALGQPMFVLSKDTALNRVVLGTDDALYTRRVRLTRLNLIAADRLLCPIRCAAKLRSRHREAPALLVPTGEDTAELLFDEPQRAPAAGQSAVAYDGDVVIGGGIIV